METAEVLNQYFASVFNRDTSVITGECPSDLVLEDCHIEVNDIVKQLDNLKIIRATGPDEMIARVIVEVRKEIVIPIPKLFCLGYKQGRLPQDWRDAIVIPIYKKGSKKDPGNYRPVSLTSIIVKIMETIIRDHLMKHLLKKKLISDFQYGFRSGRSCTLQLLNMLNDWTLKLDQKLNIDVLYTDLSKAFDSVPHRRLLSKIKQFGITGNLWNWIEYRNCNDLMIVLQSNMVSIFCPLFFL